ncbi:hypothetical protein BBQ_3323 [Burkholderia pseudomallei MSHR511]|nr:hypothetical protein BBS_1389 [Burkholderia pseudomallei NAU20B-16]AHG33709.1 hypothetical protein BBQ_3323 [Burkholderia pseudomallei MSHR511]AHG66624.1 hypothetical protein BBN_3444 [Burkholderia pseudomallei MSHR146]AIS89205.1 hypothetical protein BBU_2022 [Burkholderia pseudomallei NAU35A-3]AIV52011.1 hypothetical protein Y603_2875 [Burkholderia pseudomallei MSHR1153]KGV81751.1 hypothetical protein X887_1369 [Burkholderia pseudomallei MSHR4375]KGW27567.1 hypothetical protein Y047_1887 
MRMPEAPVNKCDRVVLWENQIRTTRQSPNVQSVTQTARVQPPPDKHLGLRVAPAYVAHIQPALLGAKHVDHSYLRPSVCDDGSQTRAQTVAAHTWT